MKRWAFLTVALYALTLLFLYTPLVLLAWPDDHNRLEPLLGLCLYFVPVLALLQAVLLLVPVAVAKGRPVKRRTIRISAALGAIPMCFMVMGFVWSVMSMIWSENSPFWQKLGTHIPAWLGWLLLGCLWLFWGIVFHRYAAGDEPRRFTSKVTTWLLRGSILEMLVAIPSHVISRQRHECCAPGISLMGIITGLSVALMAFGPSLFFLFARRIQDKTRNQWPSGKTSLGD